MSKMFDASRLQKYAPKICHKCPQLVLFIMCALTFESISDLL